jgi:hypothetical protein
LRHEAQTFTGLRLCSKVLRLSVDGVKRMLLVWIGALLIVAGVVLAATRTVQRGRLSQVRARAPDRPPDTLEPTGEGQRLSFKADVPGLVLIAAGAVILFAGAFF